MRISRRLFMAGLASATVSGCSPLAVLDTVLPKDGGSRLVARDVAYGDDERQRLDIYRPDDMPGPAPVVLFVYGGSWNSGSKDDYSFVGHAFASRGFVTVLCDYRLVPQVHFPTFVDDCAAAFRWTHDHIAAYGGNPAAINLVGHSAGAYNVVMIALDGRFLARVGLRRRMIRSVAALSGPYDFLPLSIDVTVAAFSQAPDLNRTQPIDFVDAQAPPMFLATGDADTTVYPKNTHALAEKLRKAGARVTEKTYPGLGHVDMLLALSTTFRGKAPVLDDVVRFIRTVGPTAP